MANVFRQYVNFRYPGYDGQAVKCDNCGFVINQLKFENISHIKTMGSRPDLSTDFDNLEILCAPTDYFGKKDESCHTLWERKRFDDFHKKKKQ